jgi:hypothetical protein
VLRIYDQLNQKTAIQFADYVLDKLPFRVEAIQTDGSEFQTAFHWHLADRGIRHIYIKPATPRLNGKVERSHPSTARSSTASSSASSSTTHSCSTTNSKNGRTTTTTIGRTAPSAAKPLRTPPTEDNRTDLRVNDLRQSYNAEVDGNRTRQADILGFVGFEDRDDHQAADTSWLTRVGRPYRRNVWPCAV